MKGAYVLLKRNDGKFLFQLRDNIPNIDSPDCWGFFGGHIEDDEDPQEAAIREIEEELELKIKKENLKHKATFTINGNTHTIYESSFDESQKPVLHEGTDMKYFTLEEIKNIKDKSLVPELTYYLDNY